MMTASAPNRSIVSVLALAIGAALQVVGKFLAFLIILLVPSLTRQAVADGQSLLGIMVLLPAVASFLVAALVQVMMRRRLVSRVQVISHAAVPALVVTAGNLLAVPGAWSSAVVWGNVLICTVLAAAGGWAAAVVGEALARRRRRQ